MLRVDFERAVELRRREASVFPFFCLSWRWRGFWGGIRVRGRWSGDRGEPKG